MIDIIFNSECGERFNPTKWHEEFLKIEEEITKPRTDAYICDNPVSAECASLMCMKHGIEYQYIDTNGNVCSEEVFFKLFTAPLRELDLIRWSIEEKKENPNIDA